ncbi:Bug family tripartite tricarboxylate transporter substrate binding protein [Pollutimonas bauzanensis]|uniref:Tripartite-type tricarboxylate transporter, receptor component TctC n=1 Tax=Pollutimonas bauzanensis TaxID=658167 RepID=A0A1M6AYI2_9BURK|nr:tripartite tricarboxylate transporter substrate binding protein [Pollutimonas bauzanensis]SHI41530.1 Tripartite-type tricarboxylate transporter, receptor component TctC [Pollutimonas bauzanensis]
MIEKKRRFAACVLLACSLAAISASAMADKKPDNYPNQTIRIVSILPPGGSVDSLARIISEPLSQKLGQPVIVESRPGAGGNIATQAVARSKPDGYTVLISANSHTINPWLFKNAGYSLDDFEPVIGLMRGPSVISVGAGTPYHTLKDLLDAAKAHPGTIAFGSAGNGSPHHIFGELLAQKAGVDLVHIPYRGSGPSIIDAIGGQIPVVISSLVAATPHFQSGRLRPLAVTSGRRWPSLPDLPTVAEAGGIADYDQNVWIGFFVPKGTPKEIIGLLSQNVAAIMENPEIQARIEKEGGLTEGLETPEKFGAFVQNEAEQAGRLIKALDLTAGD